MRVKCLAQEHNKISPARVRTRAASPGVKRTNHEATAPRKNWVLSLKSKKYLMRLPLLEGLYGGVTLFSSWARATQMYQFKGSTESGTDLKLVRR